MNDYLKANDLKNEKIRVAAVTPFVCPGAFESNAVRTLSAIQAAQNAGGTVIVLPKNSFSGECGDYRRLDSVSDKIVNLAVEIIAKTSACIVLGIAFKGCDIALIASNGKIVTASLLKGDYSDFLLFLDKFKTLKLQNSNSFVYKGIEVCAIDISLIEANTLKDVNTVKNNLPKLFAIPAAYPAYMWQSNQKKAEAQYYSAMLNCCTVISCSGNGESTVKYVRSGDKIVAANGQILAYADFDSDMAIAEYSPFGNSNATISEKPTGINGFDNTDLTVYPRYLPQKEECAEVYNILARGITGRVREAKASGVIFGLSGGLDSANVLIAAAHAQKYGLKRKDIICVTMPSENSSSRTATNARMLINSLGVTEINVPIGGLVSQLLGDINHDKNDVVYENAQARCRAAVLLSLANKHNALVLGTSDLSEMALGFSTYGGDQLAHYNPNSSLTKSAIRLLLKEYADVIAKKEVNQEESADYSNQSTPNFESQKKDANLGITATALLDILDTPISPELLPNQHTEKILGPYPLHEYFLLGLLAYKQSAAQIVDGAIAAFSGYDKDYIIKTYNIFVSKFFAHRFKTNFSCDGISLTPYDLTGRDYNSGFDAELYKIK